MPSLCKSVCDGSPLCTRGSKFKDVRVNPVLIPELFFIMNFLEFDLLIVLSPKFSSFNSVSPCVVISFNTFVENFSLSFPSYSDPGRRDCNSAIYIWN